MMSSGRFFPGSSVVIEDVLRDETLDGAESVRPVLVQLRAAADRPVPVPSPELQRLLDLGAGAAAPVAAVTVLETFRADRVVKGSGRYGAKRRVAATSLAVLVMLGAGTGVAAAVDGGVREGIVASVGKVGSVLAPKAPAPTPAPEPVAAPVPAAVPVPVPAPAPVAPVVVPAAPVVPVAPVEAPGLAAAEVEAPAIEAEGHGNSENAPGAARSGKAADAVEAPGAADAVEAARGGNGGDNGVGNGQGSAAKADGWVPPGQAKKEAAGVTAADRKLANLLKHLKGH